MEKRSPVPPFLSWLLPFLLRAFPIFRLPAIIPIFHGILILISFYPLAYPNLIPLRRLLFPVFRVFSPFPRLPPRHGRMLFLCAEAAAESLAEYA